MPHRLAPQARADLDDIWIYLAKQNGSEAVADRWIDAITDQFHLLAEHPKLGRARDDDLGFGTLSFSVGDYMIIYEINRGAVYILRVAHGRRDLGALPTR